MTVVAVKVLVVRLYRPRASNCTAGVVPFTEVFTCVTNAAKPENTAMPVLGLPTANRGAKVTVTGKLVGTICGLAGRDFKSMLFRKSTARKLWRT